MITTTHELKCTYCGKTEKYIDSYPLDKPEYWYRLQPNYVHSEWQIAPTDQNAGGDFCCLECILAYVQEAIKDRDNPKPYIAVSAIVPVDSD